MPDFTLANRELFLDAFIEDWHVILPRPAKVKILIVVEPGIAPGPPSAGFGLGRVVSYLRSEPFGFVNFEVDFAQRGATTSPTAVNIDPTPGDWGFRYTNFRFHSTDDGEPIINGYDEVWCFGIEPTIHNNGSNSSVTSSDYSPEDDEVAVFSNWMDAGGGVLAMGDHNFLGSAMCWKLPRVGTMRAWLKDPAEDGRSVPNRTGTDRHDTNQPQNASQDPEFTTNPAMIPNTAERDTITQPLDWKRYPVWSLTRLQSRHRPHPVLCGGSLGVINEFPDHPHEGLVVHESLIDFTAKCKHDETKDEYPTVGGNQPKSEVVAWVDPLPDPPHNFEKLDQPARHIPAIGVYDGHGIDHGRVLVDSTWHHWFDMNIANLEGANTVGFQKIRRYFQNVAIWLAPKVRQSKMLSYGAFWTVMSNAAFEELTIGTPIFTLGGQAIDILGRKTSDCLVTSWLIDLVPVELVEVFKPRWPLPDPCWSCPPEEILTQAVMGSVVQQLLPFRAELMRSASVRGKAKPAIDAEKMQTKIEAGVLDGVELALKTLESNREPLEKAVAVARDSLDKLRKHCKAK